MLNKGRTLPEAVGTCECNERCNGTATLWVAHGRVTKRTQPSVEARACPTGRAFLGRLRCTLVTTERVTKACGLLRRRESWRPTWRGWLALALGLGVLTFLFILRIHPFLAVTEPVTGGLLVVEGWAPDYALKSAIEEFRAHHYEKLYVTGGPLQWGAPLSEYKTYAQGGAAILVKMGLSSNEVQAVPAPGVQQDRTYAAAVALRQFLRQHGIAAAKVHVLTEGLHARRSRLLFQKALGKKVQVGVTSIPVPDYDPRHWWRSSAGVRGVIGETLAYLYARLFFYPKASDLP